MNKHAWNPQLCRGRISLGKHHTLIFDTCKHVSESYIYFLCKINTYVPAKIYKYHSLYLKFPWPWI